MMSAAKGVVGAVARVLLVLPLCVALAGPASRPAGPPRKTILILPFHVATEEAGYEALGEGLQELLAADLSAFPELEVVDRRHLDKVLKEHELSLSGLTEKATQIKVGRLLGARLLLSGTFTLVDSTIKINGHLFEIASSRLVRSREVTGKVEQWLDAERQLAKRLVEDLDLKMTETTAHRIDKKPDVNLHFIRGLGYFYGSKYDHAIMEFLNTLRGDEKYADARYWMARSYLAEKEPEHARIEFERIAREFPKHRRSEEARRYLETGRLKGTTTRPVRRLSNPLRIEIVPAKEMPK